MKNLIVSSFTCILLGTAPAVMAQGVPVVDAAHDFAATNAVGKHLGFKAGVPNTFAFTVPAGIVKSDIVFSDDPNTRDRTAKVRLATWKSGAAPSVTDVNYSRVRVTTIPVTAGRYFFTMAAGSDIAFAVMVRHRKAVIAPPPAR